MVCQSCLPVFWSKQSATKSLVPRSIEVTKTRPLEIMGVAPLGPGRGAIQAIFSVRLQEAGRFSSSVEPLKKGPRHWGQSVAEAGSVSRIIKVIIEHLCVRQLICVVFLNRECIIEFESVGGGHIFYCLQFARAYFKAQSMNIA